MMLGEASTVPEQGAQATISDKPAASKAPGGSQHTLKYYLSLVLTLPSHASTPTLVLSTPSLVCIPSIFSQM